MRFIHVSDVHLGATPDSGKPWSQVRAQEIYDTFEKILNIAKKEQVKLLLIPGDLFQVPPTMAMLEELDSMLLTVKDMTTVIIAGNHDFITPGCPYKRFEFESDTVVLDSEAPETMVFDDLKVCVSGQSYDRQQITEHLYDDLTPQTLETAKDYLDYAQILLAHGGDEKHCPIDYARLKTAGFDYVALGHIHKPEIIVPDHMIMAGSPEPIDVTDTGERGFVLGEITVDRDGVSVFANWQKICSRQYVDLRFETKASWTNFDLITYLKAEIMQYGEENIFRIYLSGFRPVGITYDLSKLQQEYWISDVIDETRQAFDYDRLREENEQNLLGKFIASFDMEQAGEEEKRALEYGVLALMQCDLGK